MVCARKTIKKVNYESNYVDRVEGLRINGKVMISTVLLIIYVDFILSFFYFYWQEDVAYRLEHPTQTQKLMFGT